MPQPIRRINVAANGINFEVLTCGNGPKFALCLHGFPEHAIAWRWQLPFLADLGYQVWAPNLRGYGQSTRPLSTAAYALNELLADVQSLQQAAGAKHMLLLGHDWGGTLGWYTAALWPHLLEGLVVYNAPHPIRALQSQFEPRQAYRWAYIPALLMPGGPEWLLADGGPYASFKQPTIQMTNAERQLLRSQLAVPGALHAMANWYRAYLSPLSRELREHAHLCQPIQCPVLNFAGTADRVLDISLLAGLETLAPQMNVQLYPNVQHWVNQEVPAHSNAMLAAWLGQTLGKVAA